MIKKEEPTLRSESFDDEFIIHTYAKYMKKEKKKLG